MKQYKVVDLFAGAGGLSLGFVQTKQFSIVAAAENNPNARKTYKRNHRDTRLYSDVRTIDYAEIRESFGDIDVVIGGPPCQGFSNANRQHTTIISMNNRLVKEYVRAICELTPSAFVMENVAMLRSNIHRFIVDEDDINNPIVMNLPLSDEKIELLPAGIELPNASKFIKNPSKLKAQPWSDKFFKAATVLYRYRINQLKFDSTIEKHKKILLTAISLFTETDGNDSITAQLDRALAETLSSYINGEQLTFEDLIASIKSALFVQRLLRKIKEIEENKIHIFDYIVEKDGAIYALVRSYAVLDYIRGVLDSKYSLEPMLLNAADYGAPQRRERFVIVGILRALNKQYVQPKKLKREGEYNTVRNAIEDIESVPVSLEVTAPAVTLPSIPDNISPLGRMLRGKLLYNHVSTDTRETAKARFKALKEGQNFHDLDSGLKTTYSDATRTQNTIYMRLAYDEPSGTVVNVRKSMWVHPHLDRAISIREAARLQTFPDSFVFEGTKDAQYQQVGNAVPPFLANAIANSILDVLND